MTSTRIAGFRASPNELRLGRLLRDPDGHTPNDPPAETDDQKAAREAAEAEAARSAAASTTAAKDLETANAELEALREKLKAFDGVDVAKAKENERKIAEAEAAAEEARKAAKDAAKAKAQAENDVAALTKIQAEEHKAELDRIQAERDTERNRAQTVEAELSRVRVENAFHGSKFITEETILTGSKGQRLFGDYVEVENGQVVVYDAPAGDTKRAKVMDSKGNPLPFNEAIAKVINADPDKDSLLKSKTTPGAGSKTQDGKPIQQGESRHNRLANAIGKLREQNKR